HYEYQNASNSSPSYYSSSASYHQGYPPPPPAQGSSASSTPPHPHRSSTSHHSHYYPQDHQATATPVAQSTPSYPLPGVNIRASPSSTATTAAPAPPAPSAAFSIDSLLGPGGSGGGGGADHRHSPHHHQHHRSHQHDGYYQQPPPPPQHEQSSYYQSSPYSSAPPPPPSSSHLSYYASQPPPPPSHHQSYHTDERIYRDSPPAPYRSIPPPSGTSGGRGGSPHPSYHRPPPQQVSASNPATPLNLPTKQHSSSSPARVGSQSPRQVSGRPTTAAVRWTTQRIKGSDGEILIEGDPPVAAPVKPETRFQFVLDCSGGGEEVQKNGAGGDVGDDDAMDVDGSAAARQQQQQASNPSSAPSTPQVSSTATTPPNAHHPPPATAASAAPTSTPKPRRSAESARQQKISNDILKARAILKWQEENLEMFGVDAAVKAFGGLPDTAKLIKGGYLALDGGVGFSPGRKYVAGGGEAVGVFGFEEEAPLGSSSAPGSGNKRDGGEGDENPLFKLADLAEEALGRKQQVSSSSSSVSGGHRQADGESGRGTPGHDEDAAMENEGEESVAATAMGGTSEQPAKKKRKRRTKKEMEAFRAAKMGLPPPLPSEESPKVRKRAPRRKKAAVEDGGAPGAAGDDVGEGSSGAHQGDGTGAGALVVGGHSVASDEGIWLKIVDHLMINARKVQIGEDMDLKVIGISRPLPRLYVVRDRGVKGVDDVVGGGGSSGRKEDLPRILRRRRLRMGEALDLLMVVDFLNEFGEEVVGVRNLDGGWSLDAMERFLYSVPKTWPRLLAVYYVLLSAANDGWKDDGLIVAPPRLEETQALVYMHLSNALMTSAKVKEEKPIVVPGAPTPPPAPVEDDHNGLDSDHYEFPADEGTEDGSVRVPCDGSFAVDGKEDVELRVAAEAFGRMTDFTMIPPHVHAKALWCLTRDVMATDRFGAVLDAIAEEVEGIRKDRYTLGRRQGDIKVEIKAIEGVVEGIQGRIGELEGEIAKVEVERDELLQGRRESVDGAEQQLQQQQQQQQVKRPKRQESKELDKVLKELEKGRKAEDVKLNEERMKIAAFRKEMEGIEAQEAEMKAVVKAKAEKLRMWSKRFLGMDRDTANYVLVELCPGPNGKMLSGAADGAGQEATGAAGGGHEGGGEEDVVMADDEGDDHGTERTIERRTVYHDNAAQGQFRPDGWGKDGPVFGIVVELPKEHANPMRVEVGTGVDPYIVSRPCFTQTGPVLEMHRAIDSLQALKRLYECLNDRGTRERDLALGLRNFFRTCGVSLSATQWLHKRTATAAAQAVVGTGVEIDWGLLDSGLLTCHEILTMPEVARWTLQHSSAFKAVYPGTGSKLGPDEAALEKSLGWFGDWVSSLGKDLPEVEGTVSWEEVLRAVEGREKLMVEEEEEGALAMDGSMGVAYDEEKAMMEISFEDLVGKRNGGAGAGAGGVGGGGVGEEEDEVAPPVGFADPVPYPFVMASFARRHLVSLMASLEDKRAFKAHVVERELRNGLIGALKEGVVMPNAVVDESKHDGMTVSSGALMEPKPEPKRKGRPPKGGWGPSMPKEDGRKTGMRVAKPPPLLSMSLVGVKLVKPKGEDRVNDDSAAVTVTVPPVVCQLVATFYVMTVKAFMACGRQEDAVELGYRLAVAFRKGGWSALCLEAGTAARELREASRKEKEEAEEAKAAAKAAAAAAAAAAATAAAAAAGKPVRPRGKGGRFSAMAPQEAAAAGDEPDSVGAGGKKEEEEEEEEDGEEEEEAEGDEGLGKKRKLKVEEDSENGEVVDGDGDVKMDEGVKGEVGEDGSRVGEEGGGGEMKNEAESNTTPPKSATKGRASARGRGKRAKKNW
ncbi:hypothetical protein HDU97_005129, partial [Phlyctochytrium planicorne]